MLKLRSTDGHELSSLGLVMLLLRLSHLLVVLEILIVCGILVLLSQLLHMVSWEGIPKPRTGVAIFPRFQNVALKVLE